MTEGNGLDVRRLAFALALVRGLCGPRFAAGHAGVFGIRTDSRSAGIPGAEPLTLATGAVVSF